MIMIMGFAVFITITTLFAFVGMIANLHYGVCDGFTVFFGFGAGSGFIISIISWSQVLEKKGPNNPRRRVSDLRSYYCIEEYPKAGVFVAMWDKEYLYQDMVGRVLGTQSLEFAIAMNHHEGNSKENAERLIELHMERKGDGKVVHKVTKA